jgi:uncharacterized membrane protein
MCKTNLIIAGIILFSFILSVYFYSQVPEQMATHWNSKGEVNGYMPKLWGLFSMPVVTTGLVLMLLVVPRIDPKKGNIEKFRKYYDKFIIIFVLFMVTIHLQILLWNTGIRINPNSVLPAGIGVLFYYIGNLIENAERNWFIGIRTPWTLSSDGVWRKTNRLGARLFKAAGIVAIFGVLVPDFAFLFIIIPALFIAGFTIVYSYVEYQKEIRN